MAVFTQLAKHDIESFLTYYLLDQLTGFEGIVEGVENTNYILYLGKFKNPYILTIFERRVNPRDLPFFMELIEWLADAGIPCPRPVRGVNNEMVYPLMEKPAAIVEFLQGQNKPQITPAHTTLLGTLMARLHLAAESFPMTRRNVLSPSGWQTLFSRFHARADEITPGLAKELDKELLHLDMHWPTGLPSGIIHADLFPDNVFFIEEGGQLSLSGVIDFYFACNDFWAYDLAIAMNAWCFDAAHQFVPERARALINAYTQLRPLTKAEISALPMLARGAAMRFIVTRALDWLNHVEGTQVVRKDPMEYIAKLRFHQTIKSINDYGL
jgi:homoserine kinase type II